MPFRETKNGFVYDPEGELKFRTPWPEGEPTLSRRQIRAKLRKMIEEDRKKLREQRKRTRSS